MGTVQIYTLKVSGGVRGMQQLVRMREEFKSGGVGPLPLLDLIYDIVELVRVCMEPEYLLRP